MSTRREFLLRSAATAGALGLGIVPRISLGEDDEPSPATKPLNILILGGTGFTGPEQVNYALSRGHHVTLFNRNKTRPDMFKGKVDQLIGDLNSDTSALAGKKFDVVIDNPTTFRRGSATSRGSSGGRHQGDHVVAVQLDLPRSPFPSLA